MQSIQLFNPEDIDEDGNDICMDSDECQSFNIGSQLTINDKIKDNSQE